MIQQTLVLIKPDAVRRNLIGKIIAIYEENDLKVVKIKSIKAIRTTAEEHYSEHKGKPYFEELISTITKTTIIALVIEGEDAIAKVRKINGSTNPEEAEEGTIRNLFALSKNENSVHASDSVESANKEIKLWFA